MALSGIPSFLKPKKPPELNIPDSCIASALAKSNVTPGAVYKIEYSVGMQSGQGISPSQSMSAQEKATLEDDRIASALRGAPETEHADACVAALHHNPIAASGTKLATAWVMFASNGSDIVPFYLRNDLLLGKGAQGQVFKAVNLKNNEVVACKWSMHQGLPDDIDDIKREQNTLSDLKILRATAQRGFEYKGDTTYLEATFVELFRGNSLDKELYFKASEGSVKTGQKKELPLSELFILFNSVLHEMQKFHKLNRIMRDVKPANFVRCGREQNQVVFVDMGSVLSVEEAADEKTITGVSNGYIAPELNKPQRERPGYSAQTDLYGIGILLAEMISEHSYHAHIKAQLRKLRSTQERNRSLTHEEMISGLPDIFDCSLPALTHDQPMSEEQFEAFIKSRLIRVVRSMCEPNPDDRIKPAELENELIPIRAVFKKHMAAKNPSRLRRGLSRLSMLMTKSEGDLPDFPGRLSVTGALDNGECEQASVSEYVQPFTLNDIAPILSRHLQPTNVSLADAVMADAAPALWTDGESLESKFATVIESLEALNLGETPQSTEPSARSFIVGGKAPRSRQISSLCDVLERLKDALRKEVGHPAAEIKRLQVIAALEETHSATKPEQDTMRMIEGLFTEHESLFTREALVILTELKQMPPPRPRRTFNQNGM